MAQSRAKAARDVGDGRGTGLVDAYSARARYAGIRSLKCSHDTILKRDNISPMRHYFYGISTPHAGSSFLFPAGGRVFLVAAQYGKASLFAIISDEFRRSSASMMRHY